MEAMTRRPPVLSSHDSLPAASNDNGNGNAAAVAARPRPRVHPVLYLTSLITALVVCLFLVTELAGYAPPTHRHDELAAIPDEGVATSGIQVGSPASAFVVGQNWNSIANALGGFSTSFVHSPELNVSWIARPAGFGPRIGGYGGDDDEADRGDRRKRAGVSGTLHSMIRHARPEVSDDNASGDSARRGCHVDLDTPVRRARHQGANIALIQRGDCPFISKLLNAQALKYDAAIVYNDELHSRPARHGSSGEGEYTEEEELLSMWSPGAEARLLTIPSVFVGYSSGMALQNLITLAANHDDTFTVELEPEAPPHLFIMDIVIMLFFLPTIFTTVVLVITRVRQVRYRRAQRAPKALVDSLPSFRWREGLENDIEALDSLGEKEEDPAASGFSLLGNRRKRRESLARMLAKVVRKREPAENVEEEEEGEVPALPPYKARHLARKIFSQRECAICLGDFVHDEQVKLLPCGHLYHETEIEAWLTEQKRWCPICRFPIDGVSESTSGADSSIGIAPSSTGSSNVVPSSSEALPIIQAEDLADSPDQARHEPVASSSTLTTDERTPLIHRTA